MDTPKKKCALMAVLMALFLVTGFLIFRPWETRGEYLTDRGPVYYFEDGVVAIDTTRPQHEYFIYAGNVKDVEMVEDGLLFTVRSEDEGFKSWLHSAEMKIAETMPAKRGKVRLYEEHTDYREGRYVDVTHEAILSFIERRDWDNSVRDLWESDQ